MPFFQSLLRKVYYVEMALPPTIPTSFVPHPGSAPRRFSPDFSGAFGFAAYAALAVTLMLALGVFLYGRILASKKASEDAKINAAVAAIDVKTVESFVRLRDRLASGKTLLDGHAAFTRLFSSLEKILPSSVRLTALHLTMDEDGTAKMESSGVAKSFNALAAASEALAADGNIKDAIFSNIQVNKDRSVSFSLSALLARESITYSP